MKKVLAMLAVVGSSVVVASADLAESITEIQTGVTDALDLIVPAVIVGILGGLALWAIIFLIRKIRSGVGAASGR